MILSVAELVDSRKTWRNEKVVATNGCFDVLHAGHIHYLENARAMGDRLIVGLNSDRSVYELKGPGRPLNKQEERAEVLAALRCVNDVCIFDGKRCVDFLMAAAPDIYAKGGDYTEKTMDPGEKLALSNAKIVFVPIVPGCSTTGFIKRITDQDRFIVYPEQHWPS